ncbi:MAG: serine hydrolase, partial [Nocardioides sp.]
MELDDDVIVIWEQELASVEAWSLVLRGRGVDVDVRGDRAYSGASTIKTFLLELASDSLSWEQPVTVTPEHVAAGDGVLATWPLPVTLPLHAVAQLMTALSDNTATNAVVDTLGGIVVVNDAL